MIMEKINCINPKMVPRKNNAKRSSILEAGEWRKISIWLVAYLILCILFEVSKNATIELVMIHIPAAAQFKYLTSKLINCDNGIANII